MVSTSTRRVATDTRASGRRTISMELARWSTERRVLTLVGCFLIQVTSKTAGAMERVSLLIQMGIPTQATGSGERSREEEHTSTRTQA